MLSVCLLLLCALLLHEGQSHNPGPVWPPRHRIIVEGDPCSENEETEKASSIRFESAETEASSSSRPGPEQEEASSSSSSAPMDRAEQIKELANFYAFEDRLEEAVRCYTKSIQINPSVPKYYRNRGLCRSRKDEMDLAIVDFRTALEIEPESVRGLFYLGRALLSEGELEEAMMNADKALICGQQQKLIDQVMYQVTSLQDNIRAKIKEKERARQIEVYHKMSELLVNARQKKIDKINAQHDEYVKELKAAFPVIDEEQQLLSSDHEYLRDKIDLEIMKEPVVTPSGISYERSQILKHLEEHNFDPVSRAPLHRSQLRPNKLLKEVIDAYNRDRM